MKDSFDSPVPEPDAITVEQQGALNILRFNRAAKKNAITSAMYEALSEGIRQGEESNSIRVHVFFGLPGSFTAGNDIQDFVASATEQDGLGREVLGFLASLIDTAKPIVAGVDGLAVGVGTTMLMHCDLVYSTPDSLFTTPFTSLGLVPEAASSLVGPRLMGHQRAFALLALGERWNGTDATAAGLVNALVSSDELEAKVLDVAGQLAGRPEEALRETRRLLRGNPSDLHQRIADEAAIFSRLLKSEDAQDAFARFLSR